MLQSIRARLTLWLTLLIVLCIAAFALYLYLAVGSILTAQVDQTIQSQARQIADSFDFAPHDPGAGNGQPVDVGPVDQFARAGVFIEVLDPHGHLLATSSNLGRLQLPAVVAAAALSPPTPRLYTQSIPGGSLRVYSLPAIQGGQRVGVVLVASSLQDVTKTTSLLLLLLLAGGLAIVILAALGSGLLVLRGLRPLDEMAQVAESITVRRLDRRLDLRHPPREIARLSRTFDAMLERLHNAFEDQSRFVSDASHELRTPLAVIRGRSEVLLLKSTLDMETRDGLSMMRDEAGRLGRLVANMLLLARGDAAFHIDRRPVELDALLLEVARQGQVLARDSAVVIGQIEQVVVLGDGDLLKQLLLNLVDNAVTHTPPGGRIELALSISGDEVRLAVCDTGSGIAPDELQHIFERFYRPDRTRSRRSGGVGLGLAIVRGIAEAHGGRILVQSELGRGSTFTLVLPRYSHGPTGL